MELPLSANILNKIKDSIKDLSTTFQTRTISINQIGSIPAGRKLVESAFWPIQGALKYFEQEGAITILGSNIEILKDDYFNIRLNSINLPVSFSVDKRIEANLALMTGLYAQIYDIENRLRFYIANKLEKIYGPNFTKNLPNDVQNKISQEKKKTKIFVLDTRNKELEFVDFSHLRKIIEVEDIIKSKIHKQIVIDKLDFLNEARTLIAHNVIIISSEIERIKDYCRAIKNIISTG